MVFSLQDNEVGTKVRELIKVEWRTNEMIQLSHFSSQTQTVRAFYGTHDLYVLDQGQEIAKYTFDLEKNMKVVIDLTLDGNGVGIKYQ